MCVCVCVFPVLKYSETAKKKNCDKQCLNVFSRYPVFISR